MPTTSLRGVGRRGRRGGSNGCSVRRRRRRRWVFRDIRQCIAPHGPRPPTRDGWKRKMNGAYRVRLARHLAGTQRHGARGLNLRRAGAFSPSGQKKPRRRVSRSVSYRNSRDLLDYAHSEKIPKPPVLHPFLPVFESPLQDHEPRSKTVFICLCARQAKSVVSIQRIIWLDKIPDSLV